MWASPKSRPAVRPEAPSSAGMTTSRIVPGRMVERMTTVWRDRLRRFNAAPICWQTRSIAVVSRRPLRRLGVPTQTSERSASPTAASASPIA